MSNKRKQRKPDFPTPKIVWGGSVQLWDVADLARIFKLSKRKTELMLREMRVPILYIGSRMYVDGWSIEVVLRSLMSPGGHSYAAPGSKRRFSVTRNPGRDESTGVYAGVKDHVFTEKRIKKAAKEATERTKYTRGRNQKLLEGLLKTSTPSPRRKNRKKTTADTMKPKPAGPSESEDES